MEEALNRRVEASGERSEVLDTKPVLDWGEGLIWEVFSILHSSRPIGMQASGIPIPDILALEFTTLESGIDLVRIIKSLDGVWLAWNDKQSK